MILVYLALGGAAGTLARYALQGWLQGRDPAGAFPIGTLVINVAGSLLLGFLMRFATGSTVVAPEARAGLTIGLCGAFTTMSTFSYETVRMLGAGDYWRAGLYAGGTILGSLGATIAGIAMADKLL